MGLFDNIAPNFIDILSITWQFFINGGWVLFVIGMIYVLYKSYRMEIEHQFVHSQNFILLSIRVPRENRVSTLAVDNMFAQMHALFAGLTFAQKYLEGRIQLWYSLEIISMGGKVSFIVRTPAGMRNVVEAAVYTQYPEAEITEVEDYMQNFNYNPDDESNEFDVWGTEWKLETDYVIPIKTYKDFEHPAAEEKIIDPLAQHFESLAKMEPHEFFGVQIITQPINDDAWKPIGEKKVKELTGEEIPHEFKFSDLILAPLDKFAHFSFKSLLGGGHDHGHEQQNKPLNRWMNMTDVEKERVNAVERKIGKPGYKTKIRHMYIAPKDKFDPTKKSMITGYYRPLGSIMTNKLKPEMKTWTSVDYIFSPTLEQPYLDWLLKRKKRYIFKGYKNRDIHIGSPMYILNTEELATIYHFPITTETRLVPAAVEATLSKKSQPPVDLPVVE